MNKRLIILGTSVLVLAAVFFFAQSALAGDGTTLAPCGASDPAFGANGLLVKKTVNCGMDRLWNWQITKLADVKDLVLAIGQSFTVNYSVTVNATAETNYAVGGVIGVQNTSGIPVVINSISDNLGTVTCPDIEVFPFTLNPSYLIECTYSGNPRGEAPENVATVVDSNNYAVSAVAPIDWSLASGEEIDECVDVSDDLAGFLGTVCASESAQTFTFEYPLGIGPYEVCGMYEVPNIASFATNDSGETGSDDQNVSVVVPCEGGCTLTPGYWKTHSEYGPAPYDDTWAILPDGANTTFFNSGQSYYEVLWTEPKGGNAYYILAHAYIAAELNMLNGADSAAGVDNAMAAAKAFFETHFPYDPLSKAVRADAIAWAEILDAYNNGLIGPGHCSE